MSKTTITVRQGYYTHHVSINQNWTVSNYEFAPDPLDGPMVMFDTGGITRMMCLRLYLRGVDVTRSRYALPKHCMAAYFVAANCGEVQGYCEMSLCYRNGMKERAYQECLGSAMPEVAVKGTPFFWFYGHRIKNQIDIGATFTLTFDLKFTLQDISKEPRNVTSYASRQLPPPYFANETRHAPDPISRPAPPPPRLGIRPTTGAAPHVDRTARFQPPPPQLPYTLTEVNEFSGRPTAPPAAPTTAQLSEALPTLEKKLESANHQTDARYTALEQWVQLEYNSLQTQMIQLCSIVQQLAEQLTTVSAARTNHLDK